MTVEIIQGDAREALRAIPAESVDCIITSPPYNIGRNYGQVSDSMPEDEFRRFNEEWLRQALRVCREGTRAYVVVSEAMLFWFRDVAEAAGWRYHQLLFWCKPNLARVRGISGDWNRLVEPIFDLHKGKRTAMVSSSNHSTTHNWFVAAAPQSNFRQDKKIHPAQFAEALVARLLSRTPCSLVLDPFAGSGTVGKVATAFGKSAVLIELNPDYCEMARQRTAQLGLVSMEART